MRATLIAILLFTCALTKAQVNFVKNPDFEQYSHCPGYLNQITYAKFWSSAVDTLGTPPTASEYFNVCGNDSSEGIAHVPENVFFYQYPHSGNGMSGAAMYYDRTMPPPPGILSPTLSECIQGRLIKPLEAGKSYCVTFFINNAEASGYAHNKIGAFLDNGTFDDTVSIPGSSMTFITPQIFTNDVLKDTATWEKIEGTFISNGTETYITIGNFFKNSDLSTIVTFYWSKMEHYSEYLIDDISVIETDLPADFGPDAEVMVGSSIQIGRVGDTTAKGLDCKWYHKGALIDSGAIITVNAASIAGIVDTYSVVQTICGNVKNDTVLVSTFSVGVHDPFSQLFRVYPNPSDGFIYIQQLGLQSQAGPAMSATVYDLCGRVVLRQPIYPNSSSIELPPVPGIYILELEDEQGNRQRERIVIQ